MTPNTIICGHNLLILREWPDACVDAVVTDPPYGLKFMGKKWDRNIPKSVIWREVLRVLKPGGYLLSFFGTRTYHRGVCAVEDAGFEIRDQIGWVYGSGFPKSLDVGKTIDKEAGAIRAREKCGGLGSSKSFADDKWTREHQGQRIVDAPVTAAAARWNGWGTALKPAWEPIVLARKPLDGTVVQNVLKYGTGGINVSGCRTTEGRWPADLVHDGSDEVVALFPNGKSTPFVENDPGTYLHNGGIGKRNAGGFSDSGSAARFFQSCQLGDNEWLESNLGLVNTANNHLSLQNPVVVSALNDAVTSVLPGDRQSSVSRAPSIPATPSELRRLCESAIATIQSIEDAFWQGHLAEDGALPNHVKFVVQRKQMPITTITLSHWKSDGSADDVTFNITPRSMDHGEVDYPSRLRYCAKASQRERNAGAEEVINEKGRHGNSHSTVKPLALMRYLCRLVTPPGGLVLDPFCGSGSTCIAAMQEGFTYVGIDRDEKSCEIANARLAHWSKHVE